MQPSDETWASQLAARRVLPLNDRALISIKRDVHTIDVDVSPQRFATAFHETMAGVDTRFGHLEVRRPPARRGQPFVVGDRFQGRFDVRRLLSRVAARRGRDVSGPLSGENVRRWLDRVSDTQLSDYGVIDELDLDSSAADSLRMRYRYLEGSPIAGSSTFCVTPRGSGSRITQVFIYQELHLSSAALFSVIGVRIHNQVVFDQVRQSAERVGARVLDTDIPEAYRSLDG